MKAAAKALAMIMLAQLSVYLPFVASPLLNPILVYFLAKVVERVLVNAERFFAFKLIDIKTQAEADRLEEATANLKTELTKVNRDESALEAARAEFRRRTGDLIRIKPSPVLR